MMKIIFNSEIFKTFPSVMNKGSMLIIISTILKSIGRIQKKAIEKDNIAIIADNTSHY